LVALLLFAGCGSNGDKKNGLSLDDKYREALKEENPQIRAKKLITIAGKQQEAGTKSAAKQSLKDALKAAGEIEAARDRAALLNSIAYAQGKAGLIGDAKDTLKATGKAIEEIEDAASKIRETARRAVPYHVHLKDAEMAKAQMDSAEQLAETIENPAIKVESLLDVAYNYNRMQLADDVGRLVDKAVEAAKTVEDPRARCDAVVAVARKLITMKKKDKATTFLEEAVKLTDAIEEPVTKGHAMAEIAKEMGRAGDAAGARKLLDKAEGVAVKIDDVGLKKQLNKKIADYKDAL